MGRDAKVDIGQAIKHSLDDAGGAFKSADLGPSVTKTKGKARTHNSETEGMDVFDGKPDMAKKPDAHKPNDGNGGTKKNPDGTEKRRGIDTGGGRDDYGHFVSSDNKPWVDKEKLGLDQVADENGVDVIRDQVASRIEGHRKPGADADQIRYFDGLFKNADGTYTGVEVKSGSATRNAQQRAFDEAINAGKPASAYLDGLGWINITSVILKEVP